MTHGAAAGEAFGGGDPVGDAGDVLPEVDLASILAEVERLERLAAQLDARLDASLESRPEPAGEHVVDLREWSTP